MVDSRNPERHRRLEMIFVGPERGGSSTALRKGPSIAMTEAKTTGVTTRIATDAAQFDKGDESTCEICLLRPAVGVDAETRLSVCRKCAVLEVDR
nr:hypothetical protein [Haloferax sp. Atlit-48N]